MTEQRMTDQQWNPWKLATIGIVMVCATALLTGVVVAHYAGTDRSVSAAPGAQALPESAGGVSGQPPAQAGLQAAPLPPLRQVPPTPGAHDQQASAAPSDQRTAGAHVAPRPVAQDISACNRYASSASHSKTAQTLTDALLGGALGAGLGAAGGAIAGGGGGAGKGAGIGGLVGAAAGTLYGLNDANRNDARAAAAYRACMKQRGYGG